MTKHHNPALPPAGVGASSAPVWEVYPFRLELLCSEDAFHRERARIRMRAGLTPLNQLADVMAEMELWNERSEEERAKDAKLIAGAMRFSEQEKAIFGV